MENFTKNVNHCKNCIKPFVFNNSIFFFNFNCFRANRSIPILTILELTKVSNYPLSLEVFNSTQISRSGSCFELESDVIWAASTWATNGPGHTRKWEKPYVFFPSNGKGHLCTQPISFAMTIFVEMGVVCTFLTLQWASLETKNSPLV